MDAHYCDPPRLLPAATSESFSKLSPREAI
jgi:hypothetical protein